MGFSVGIGLTNACNLACAHCYRDTQSINYLSLDQVKKVCDSIPVDAMGMGTGENILNPDFVEIASYLNDQGVKISIASNGHSLMTAPEHILKMFSDVEVSIDFPSESEQDRFRGSGNWSLVHQAIERCQGLGIEVSILSTLMCTNFDQMDSMVALARSDGCNLRVNAYQAVKTDAFRLSYEQFWEGYRRLFSAGLVVACSEPVVRAQQVYSTAMRLDQGAQIVFRHCSSRDTKTAGRDFKSAVNDLTFAASGCISEARHCVALMLPGKRSTVT